MNLLPFLDLGDELSGPLLVFLSDTYRQGIYMCRTTCDIPPSFSLDFVTAVLPSLSPGGLVGLAKVKSGPEGYRQTNKQKTLLH